MQPCFIRYYLQNKDMRIFKNGINWWIVALIILIIPTFYQLIRPGFFPMQDDLQAFRVEQMVKCLKDFQIPCRWIPDMGYQYGYPQFNYYGPLPFYFGAGLNLLGIQIIDAVKILFILGFVLSAVSMFIFLRAILDERAAFFGTILYTYAPFKAAEVYVRGSLSEFLVFIFMPLLFWSSYQFIKLKKTKYLLWFALSLGFLLTTHNLTSLIFLPILLVWIATQIILQKDWKVFLKIVLGGLLGLGLSAFYLLPVIFEGRFVHLETLIGGYFDYRQHFVSLYQMLILNYFGYGSSVFGLGDDVTLSTGQTHWMIALLALILSFIFYKKYKNLAITIWVLSAVELLVLFMMHQKSHFLWENLNFLIWLQFPWRFLIDSVFLLSILGGFAFFLLSKINQKLAISIGLIVIVLVMVLHGSFFRPKSWLDIADADKFSGDLWEKQLTISIFDYLPNFAKFPPNKKAPALPEVLQGEADFKNYKKGSNFQKGLVEVKEDAIIRAPIFDFPGMKVTANGKLVDHINNNCTNEQYCLGLVTFNLPRGTYDIEVRLHDTPIRQLGNIISIGSMLLLLSLGFKYANKKFS